VGEMDQGLPQGGRGSYTRFRAFAPVWDEPISVDAQPGRDCRAPPLGRTSALSCLRPGAHRSTAKWRTNRSAGGDELVRRQVSGHAGLPKSIKRGTTDFWRTFSLTLILRGFLCSYVMFTIEV
jgi:hypothetical protein